MPRDVAYFQDRLNAAFLVGEVALVLVEVAPSGNPLAFSLTFHGPADPAFAQQTLVMERAGDEPLAIFVVPLGRDASGTLYQAIFNN